ncbi:hypothetical protein ABW19_dt0204331 [Dactylella cylindrospora]|nr:hypothetical protein ABW19_dt0204331 [Dactylella cylindrospora]
MRRLGYGILYSASALYPLFTFILIRHSLAKPLSPPSCPQVLPELTGASIDATPSNFVWSFNSYITALGSTPWFSSTAKYLFTHTVSAYELLTLIETEGLATLPYPINSLRDLYEFIAENKLHCYAKRGTAAGTGGEQLLRALITLNENDGMGFAILRSGGSIIDSGFGSGASSPLVQPQGDQSENEDVVEGMQKLQIQESIQTPFAIDPQFKFQYINVNVGQVLSALVYSHSFQIDQLIQVAKAAYPESETQLLVRTSDFWSNGVRRNLVRVLTLMEKAEEMLRSGGNYNAQDAEKWLDLNVKPWEPGSQPDQFKCVPITKTTMDALMNKFILQVP